MADPAFTTLNRAQLSKLTSDPQAIAMLEDIQQQAFVNGPKKTEEARVVAEDAKVRADEAKLVADDAIVRADAAQGRADDAYELADGKVDKDAGPSFAAPSGAVSRTALPAYTSGTAGAVYTAADVQELMDQVAALTGQVAALVTDLRDNHSLTN